MSEKTKGKPNSRWGRGKPRFLPNRSVDHPAAGSITESAMISRFAREKEGWRQGARISRR